MPHLGQLLPLSGQPSPCRLPVFLFLKGQRLPQQEAWSPPQAALSASHSFSPLRAPIYCCLPCSLGCLPGQPLPLDPPTRPRPLPACLVASPSCLPGARRGALLPVPPARPLSFLQRPSGKQGLEPKHREENSIPSTPDSLQNSTRSNSRVQS